MASALTATAWSLKCIKLCCFYFLFWKTCLGSTNIVHSKHKYIHSDSEPFTAVWNTPSFPCEKKYGIKLDFTQFDIVGNTNDSFLGDKIVIFYERKFGLYPWISEDGDFVHGGLPQLANLKKHLDKVRIDVDKVIPYRNFQGLAVIDWEKWRPTFQRNDYDEPMKVYIRESENIVKNKHPDWSDEQVRNKAEKEFENGARTFMQSTLELCQTLRPLGVWGFYGFPDCYNHGLGEKICSNETKYLNDRLAWLFNTSTALVPSIYLSEDMGPHVDRFDKVYGTLQETVRVNWKFGNSYKPLYAYTRFRYGDTGEFYDMIDLRSTIKQAVDTGFFGVALWDSSRYFRSRNQCEAMRQYLDNRLGPYVKNITASANTCSNSLCHAHGRCVSNNITEMKASMTYERKRTLVDNILKTITSFFYYVEDFLTFFQGNVSQELYDIVESVDRMNRTPTFHCSCYKSWTGVSCDRHYMSIK